MVFIVVVTKRGEDKSLKNHRGEPCRYEERETAIVTVESLSFCWTEKFSIEHARQPQEIVANEYDCENPKASHVKHKLVEVLIILKIYLFQALFDNFLCLVNVV